MHRLSESVHCDSSPENNKIITLIRQKIYPLHYDHVSYYLDSHLHSDCPESLLIKNS